jgi:hypothetical protein
MKFCSQSEAATINAVMPAGDLQFFPESLKMGPEDVAGRLVRNPWAIVKMRFQLEKRIGPECIRADP